MRLDVFLLQSGLVKSRTEAKKLILEGHVRVGEKIITQPAFSLDENTPTSLCAVDKSHLKYVSRGGYKLEAALAAFSLSSAGQIALDVGASSGGFTDCLLQNGASHVYAVDAGEGQLAASLLGDERVTLKENYNARYMKKSDFPHTPTFAVMDVSFISQTLILPALYDVLAFGADLITLVKPQFELTRSALNKKGIVKSDDLREDAIARVTNAATFLGFRVMGVIQSPIEGGDGNIEFLLYLKKGDSK